jgi:hypothetical protein
VNLLLSEDMPLRTSRVLGDFAADFVLGHAYGDLTKARIPAERLDETRFFVADHVFDLTDTFVDAQKTLTWEQSLESDGAGHTWTIVTLGAPAPAGAVVSVSGFGKRDPRSGALIENPGDVLDDICRIAGRSDNWQAIRDETSALGIKIAGRIGAVKSIRAQIDEVCQSIGAIWSAGMARVYPADAVSGRVFEFDQSVVTLGSVSASLEDTFDVLRLGYDFSEAAGRAQRFIELTANPPRFGGVVKEVTYLWLRTTANAEAVGRRVLGRGAGERYAVSFRSQRAVRPGDWTRLKSLREWPLPGDDPDVMSLGVTIDERTGIADVTGETLRAVPTIAVTGHTIALPDTADASLHVVTVNGLTTITVSKLDGKPLKGAHVALDGAAAKTTDANGQVFFRVAAGPHDCLIEATGMDPVELQIITGV